MMMILNDFMIMVCDYKYDFVSIVNIINVVFFQMIFLDNFVNDFDDLSLNDFRIDKHI